MGVEAGNPRPSSRQAAHAVLLACDRQQSVLMARDATQGESVAWSPYGHRRPKDYLALLGFNGQLPDRAMGNYLLGNGYRAYNPVLMRFNSPDSWSPFGDGGINPYAYCVGDPVNHRDPTGHAIGLALLMLARSRARGAVRPTVLKYAKRARPMASSGAGVVPKKRRYDWDEVSNAGAATQSSSTAALSGSWEEVQKEALNLSRPRAVIKNPPPSTVEYSDPTVRPAPSLTSVLIQDKVEDLRIQNPMLRSMLDSPQAEIRSDRDRAHDWERFAL